MAEAGKPEYWSDEETLTLVKLRIKYDNMFSGNKGNTCRGWKLVIEKLKEAGITRENDKKIRRKWSDELKRYKNLVEPSAKNTGIGTEDGDVGIGEDMDSEIFDLLFEYHKLKHSMNPPALLDTSMPSTSTGTGFVEHNYATGKSEYLGSTIVPDEYLLSEDEIPSAAVSSLKTNTKDEDEDADDSVEDDEDVSIKASGSKRCSEYYNKSKKVKKVKKSNDDWFKEFLVQNREERKQEMAQLVGALKDLVPK